MIGGEWKRAGRDRQSPLLVGFRLYGTPVGAISELMLFRLVAFWGRSAMRWSVQQALLRTPPGAEGDYSRRYQARA
jgi:hypothetical protein